MVKNYQYPTIQEQRRYCPYHEEFLLEQYGGKCAHCNFDYLFLLSQDHDFTLPKEIEFFSLYYTNIQISTIVMAIEIYILWRSLIVSLVLILILYNIFKKIADGIGRVSRGSYLTISFFPVGLFLATMLTFMIHLEVDRTVEVLLLITIIFAIPPLKLYSSEKTRNLYNLSDTMYVKLQNKFDFDLFLSTEYLSKKDSLKLYLKRFLMSLVIIIAYPLILILDSFSW